MNTETKCCQQYSKFISELVSVNKLTCFQTYLHDHSSWMNLLWNMKNISSNLKHDLSYFLQSWVLHEKQRMDCPAAYVRRKCNRFLRQIQEFFLIKNFATHSRFLKGQYKKFTLKNQKTRKHQTVIMCKQLFVRSKCRRFIYRVLKTCISLASWKKYILSVWSIKNILA